MRPILLGLVVGLLALAMGSASRAEVVATGSVSYVSDQAIEIDGTRILLTAESVLMSGGREISVASLRRGMPARAEIDEAGRLIELHTNGVVE